MSAERHVSSLTVNTKPAPQPLPNRFSFIDMQKQSVIYMNEHTVVVCVHCDVKRLVKYN